jgi:hypothetical protein
VSSASRRLAGLAVCLSLSLSLSAWAQSSPDAGTSADAGTPSAEAPPEGLSAEELKELEEALGTDAAAAASAQGGTTSAPAGATSTTPSSGLTMSPQNIGFSWLNISFVLDTTAAAFTSKEPLQTGGHDPGGNGFNLQQLELSVNAVVDPYFRFDSNIVFSQFGVEIEEAYATVFGAEGNRGLGAEASWLTPLPWYVELVGSATDASGGATARSFLGTDTGGVTSPLDFQFTGAVKQFFELSDDLSLLWGMSGANGPNPTGYRNRTDVFGTDVYLKYRPLRGGSFTIIALQAEVLYRRRQVPDDVLWDVNGYGQLTWRFLQRWATAARYELGTPARSLGGGIAPDPLDPEWEANRQRISANVSFYPTEFSRLRLQGATDLVGWRDRPDYSVFLALEVVIGAHGAHAF